MTEEWKAIEGYEGYYEVSSLGAVRSVPRTIRNGKTGKGSIRRISARIMKQHLSGKNRDYRSISLHRDCAPKTHNVHSLVAVAFVPNPENLPEVNHKDTNKDNNQADNLEWCTRQFNCRHAITNGVSSSLVGVDNICAVLTDEKVLLARRLRREGVSLKGIATIVGTSDKNISSITRRKSWKHL